MGFSDFDRVALAYDSSIDWEERLRREIPFIVEMAGGPEGKRMLDLACGTGRHAIALSELGAHVVGVDTSVQMITRAREMAAESKSSVEFVVADMADIKSVISGRFDMVICLGNSLALLSSQEVVQQVIGDVYELLLPGGVFLFQILNFEEILSSGFRFMPVKVGRTADGKETVFFRFFKHNEESRVSTLVLSAFEEREHQWHVRMSSTEVLQLSSKTAYDMMSASGFREIEIYSSFDGESFESQEDRNVIGIGRV
jgi:ubiquinone/menaquinone biosynthesis C-methylase UbiE